MGRFGRGPQLMSGVLSAIIGTAGSNAITVTVGVFEISGKVTLDWYGYSAINQPGGSITNGAFAGATVLEVVSRGSTPGYATTYMVTFSGNRAAGFFHTLRVNNTLVSGTLSAPSYDGGNDRTTFTITLSGASVTLFGTTTGAKIPVTIT